MEEWKKKLNQATQDFEELNEQVKEREQTMLVLKGELHALEIDLIKAGDKSKGLGVENQQLVSRWISKRNQEAESMNEVNQIFEEMKSKQEEEEKRERERRVEAEHQKVIEESKNWKPNQFDMLDQ